MAQQKGKSHKIHQAIRSLENAITQWDSIDTEALANKTQSSSKDLPPEAQAKTRQLLDELKQQLEDFNSEK